MKKYGIIGWAVILIVILLILFLITALKILIWITIGVVAITFLILAAALDSADGYRPKLFGLTGLVIFIYIILGICYWLLCS